MVLFYSIKYMYVYNLLKRIFDLHKISSIDVLIKKIIDYIK